MSAIVAVSLATGEHGSTWLTALFPTRIWTVVAHVLHHLSRGGLGFAVAASAVCVSAAVIVAVCGGPAQRWLRRVLGGAAMPPESGCTYSDIDPAAPKR